MNKIYFAFLILIIFSCSRTEVPFGFNGECVSGITYTENVEEIINNSCAYVGCHLNNEAPGNFDTFSGLSGAIDNGEFFSRAVVVRDMPPSSVPDDRPRFLTDNEIAIITCWAENDYPE